ncbi:LacI family DNA-binding transcriptional regulator [Bacillus sp. FJAT-49711]|uniref:LacI family DNA-binding transcriptional regulator n=1 Tax=Bacillus sp. FJAT-49711 TaxID=2833585 RepID=UPI001BCA1EE2|nr:LacI family DNA-binding transcriptional regulator [Bacillus sp. FJAT-49711]MBS4218071.1 LacI family DNA-binding transcriptional regulator [Bacillus sp. FJAT-49711]
MKRWTIKDIAKKAGVSITTVSRVLNQKEEGMSTQTREKVLKVMKEVDFQPNQFARGLVTKRSKTFGLIVPNISNPYFPELCRGVEDEANEGEYSLIICNSDDQTDKEKRYLRLLEEQQVDGIIFSAKDHLDESDEEQLARAKIPFVLIDRGKEEKKHVGVFLDNDKGGYLAGKHLIELGHRSIACITGPKSITLANERLQGFKRALNEAGVDLLPSQIIEANFQMEMAYHKSKEILNKREVTAIFASNDMMACGVYQMAHELGIRIPIDLSIVGFDDIPLISALIPKLTTIQQNTYEMGREAVRVLFRKIENMETKSVIFSPNLVVRDSTAPIQ